MGLDYNELILGDKTDAFLRRLAINLANYWVLNAPLRVFFTDLSISICQINDFFDSYLDSLTPHSQ